MPFLFPSFLIRTSPLPLTLSMAELFAAFLAGSHADIETVIKEIKAEIRIDGQEITNFSSKYISFIIIWDRAFNSSRNRLITPTPPLVRQSPARIPIGMPSTDKKMLSYRTDLIIWRLVAPTHFNVPNWEILSPALIRNTLEITTTAIIKIMAPRKNAGISSRLL